MLKRTLILSLAAVIFVFAGGILAEQPDNPQQGNYEQPEQMQRMQAREKTRVRQNVPQSAELVAALDEAYHEGDMQQVGRIIQRMKHQINSRKADSQQHYQATEARQSYKQEQQAPRRRTQEREEEKYAPTERKLEKQAEGDFASPSKRRRQKEAGKYEQKEQVCPEAQREVKSYPQREDTPECSVEPEPRKQYQKAQRPEKQTCGYGYENRQKSVKSCSEQPRVAPRSKGWQREEACSYGQKEQKCCGTERRPERFRDRPAFEPYRKADKYNRGGYHRKFEEQRYERCPCCGAVRGFRKEYRQRGFEQKFRGCPGQGNRNSGYPVRERGFNRNTRRQSSGHFTRPQGYNYRSSSGNRQQSEGFPWGW